VEVDSIVVVTPVVVSVAESDESLVATNANAITVVAIARTAMWRRS
jgi:acyl-CoA thioesterase FadM